MDTTQTQSVIKPLVDDAVQVEKEVQALIAAYKVGGAKSVAALLPALVPDAQKIYTDVKAALPTIKAGYKTTEFWIVLGVEVTMAVFTVMGKVAPLDSATIMGAVAAVYAVVRGLAKKA